WVEGAWIWWGLVAAGGVAVLWPSLEDPSRRWHARVGLAIAAFAVYGAMLGPDVRGGDHARAALVLVTSASLVLLVSVLLWGRLPAGARPASRGGLFFHVPEGPPSEVLTPGRDLVGRTGRAMTDLNPDGVALFEGERVDVSTEGDWVEEGQPVLAVNAEGIHVLVRAVERPKADDGAV
ncbi:MAG TPA: NfeD family protein, partial [Longimicrobiales bacterium]